MRIAYLVQCHKNFDQVNILIKTLACENADVFVHIDANINADNLSLDNRAFVLPDKYRVKVIWGHFSQVQATMNLIQYARLKRNYDYYVLLSGQCLPIVSNDNLFQFFSTHNGYNFVNLAPSRNTTGKNTQFDKRNELFYPAWMLKRGKLQVFIRRAYQFISGGKTHTFFFIKRRNKINFYYGSSWWAFTNDFISYVIKFFGDRLFLSQFKYTMSSDECYFQTIFMNSTFANTRQDYLQYIDWSDSTNGSPKIFKLRDYDRILASKKLFARKFDANIDLDIIHKITDNL